MLAIETIGPGHIPVLADTLTEAFFDNPMYCSALPEDEKRRVFLDRDVYKRQIYAHKAVELKNQRELDAFMARPDAAFCRAAGKAGQSLF